MKKFLSKVGLFLLPLIIFSFLLEFLIRRIPNDYNYKKTYLDNHSKEINKLFLGSSHAYYGINPKYISENSFNAGYISQTIDLDYEILKKYKNKWNNLKYIIIPIDYFTLFTRLSTSIEYWRLKNYNIYYDMNLSNSLSDNSELLSINFKSNLKRIVSYYLKKKNPLTCTKLGFGKKYKNKKDLFITGKEAAIRHTVKNFSKLNESIKILESIIQYASKNDIRVIFYTSPAYNTYVSNLNKRQLDLTINTITKLAKNNNNCVYFNFLTNSNFNSSDFRDADHLNPQGAKKFSKILDSMLIHYDKQRNNISLPETPRSNL